MNNNNVNNNVNNTNIIHVWSGPRSLSTALMYSFSQRPDCKVFDEPLYANYLRNFASQRRPYKQQLIDSNPKTGNEILLSLNNDSQNKLVFAKHIVKQFTDDLDINLLTQNGSKHVILIRNPFDMIMSWSKKESVHNESQDIDGTNVIDLVQLFFKLRKITGVTPLVVDADKLKIEPERILSELCFHLNIPFYTEQLSWPAGPKPEIDGIWASFWYDSVHQTTGFISKVSDESESSNFSTFTPENYRIYRDAFPFYEMLRNYSIGLNPMSRGQTQCPYINSNNYNNTPHTIIDHGKTIQTDATTTTTTTTTTSLSDPRNSETLIWVGNRLLPREYANVSVFDSTVQGGDAVWEGLRIYNGRVFKLEEHIERLMDSAKALAFERIPEKSYVKNAIFKTLKANGMYDDTHIRLTLSRGTKVTSSMNPDFNIFGCVLLVVPEWKSVGGAASYNNQVGIKLTTSYNRRNTPSCLDSKIHHCNLINNILAKIQANQSGAADALMLDIDGFVSETNATNLFMIKRGKIYTPHATACLPGITRQTIINLVAEIPELSPIIERNISLVEFHAADEVFTTGTMGELTPVFEIDGRKIGDDSRPITNLIQEHFRKLTETEGVPIV